MLYLVIQDASDLRKILKFNLIDVLLLLNDAFQSAIGNLFFVCGGWRTFNLYADLVLLLLYAL